MYIVHFNPASQCVLKTKQNSNQKKRHYRSHINYTTSPESKSVKVIFKEGFQRIHDPSQP